MFCFLEVIYFERERVGEGQRKGGGERIPSRLCAVGMEPDTGLEFMNHEVMT